MRGERGIPREQLSVSGYWRLGADDEGWRATKRDWLATIEKAEVAAGLPDGLERDVRLRQPGGIGAKMAEPDRDVFIMVGDGSYLMMATELVTAVQEGVKVILVLVQNHGFASIGSLSKLWARSDSVPTTAIAAVTAGSTAASCRWTWPPTRRASVPT